MPLQQYFDWLCWVDPKVKVCESKYKLWNYPPLPHYKDLKKNTLETLDELYSPILIVCCERQRTGMINQKSPYHTDTCNK